MVGWDNEGTGADMITQETVAGLSGSDCIYELCQ